MIFYSSINTMKKVFLVLNKLPLPRILGKSALLFANTPAYREMYIWIRPRGP